MSDVPPVRPLFPRPSGIVEAPPEECEIERDKAKAAEVAADNSDVPDNNVKYGQPWYPKDEEVKEEEEIVGGKSVLETCESLQSDNSDDEEDVELVNIETGDVTSFTKKDVDPKSLVFDRMSVVEEAFEVIFGKSRHITTKIVKEGGTSGIVYLPKMYNNHPVTIIVWDKLNKKNKKMESENKNDF